MPCPDVLKSLNIAQSSTKKYSTFLSNRRVARLKNKMEVRENKNLSDKFKALNFEKIHTLITSEQTNHF
jgi:hypothetical protein